MTEKIESEQAPAEEDQPVDAAQELAEAEAGFSSGFNRVAGKQDHSTSPEKPDEPEKPADTKPDEAEDKSKAEDDTKAKDDQKVDDKAEDKDDPTGKTPDADDKQEVEPDSLQTLQRRVRRVEGKIGGIADKLDTLNEAIKAKAEDVTTSAQAGETKDQIDAALKNLKDLEALGQDMEELRPIVNELKDLRANMAQREKQPDPAPQAQPQMSVEEIVELTTLNVKHPGWSQTTKTPEFKTFALQGGPTPEEYAEYATLANDPKTEREADDLVKGWAEDFPKWWEDRGQRFFESPNGVEDSISLLDEFSAKQQAVTDKQQQQQKQQARKDKRLANALTPEGVEDDPVQGIDDDAAFARGFKKIASKNFLR